MKRFMCFAVLATFSVVAPLAGCGGVKTADESEGAETVEDPTMMMEAAALPEGGTGEGGAAAGGATPETTTP